MRAHPETDPTARTKLLFVITKSNWGGAQRYVYDLATSLPREQFATSVALGGDGILKDKLVAAGIRVVPIPGLERDISLRKELAAALALYRICRAEQPDIVHLNSSKAGGLGALAGRLARVPRIIFTAHGWAFNEARPNWQRIVFKIIHWVTVLLSHLTICVADAVRHQMDWWFTASKLITIHNGRALPAFLDRKQARTACLAAAPGLASRQDELWTGTIAELHPVKRHDVAIRAVATLVQEGAELRHLIIGAGQERAALVDLIEELSLTEHVYLLGHIDEAAALLPALDIFVLPSRSEALAYVAVEAAQAGLPIVASAVGGLPEIITDQATGLLVPAEDPAALAAALRRLVADPELRRRYGAAAKQRSTEFSLPRMVDATCAAYFKTYHRL